MIEVSNGILMFVTIIINLLVMFVSIGCWSVVHDKFLRHELVPSTQIRSEVVIRRSDDPEIGSD